MKELMEVYKEALRKLRERHDQLVQEIHVYDKRVTLLEEEMVSFAPGNQKKSPDRMDALVWALTELADSGKKFILAC